MPEEPVADAASPTRWKTWLAWLGLPLVIAAFAALDVAMKSRPATAAARAFVGAARADRASDVRAHATERLARRLEAKGDASLARTYEQVRASQEIGGGFVGEWTHGCIDGRIGDQRVWFLMVKERGAWLVDDLRPDPRPSECEFE